MIADLKPYAAYKDSDMRDTEQVPFLEDAGIGPSTARLVDDLLKGK